MKFSHDITKLNWKLHGIKKEVYRGEITEEEGEEKMKEVEKEKKKLIEKEIEESR